MLEDEAPELEEIDILPASLKEPGSEEGSMGAQEELAGSYAGLGKPMRAGGRGVPSLRWRLWTPLRTSLQAQYAGSMSQWYRSSVLILFRNEDVMSIGMSLKGNEWSLQQLNACGTPDARSEGIVSAVLRHLDRVKYSAYTPSSTKDKDRQSADTIVRLAIAWKRPDLWNRAIRHCGPALQTVNTALPAALKAFQLESIKPGIVQLTKQDSALQVRFAVIKAIAAVLGPMHSPWIDNLAKDALSSYRAAAVADIPMLIEIARDRGVGIIEASILPHVAKTGTYDFLMNLAKALLNYRSTLERSPLPSEQTRAAITNVIRQCVLAAMPQWQITTTAPGKGASAIQGRANRLSELLDFCFQIEDLDLCMSVAKTASKTGTFDSCFAFARTLRGYVKKLPETNENAAKIEDLKKAIRTCIAAAISKWEFGVSQAVETQRVRDLVAFCFKIGSRGFCMTLFNAIGRTASYEVLMELAKIVSKYISGIGGSEAVDPTVEQAKEDLRQVVRLSLGAAASRWESGVHAPTPHGSYHGARPSQPSTKGPNPKASRICEFIGFCLSINELGPCVTLFNTLLKLPSKTTYDARFKEIFIPLIPQLKATLAKHGKTPTLDPFASFFRLLISLYLSKILSPNTPETVPAAPPTRKAGCANCPHCAQLQAFLNNSNKEVHFRDVQAVRTHVEKEISRARIGDVVTVDTIKTRTPYTLVVTKRQEYLSQLVWKTVQAEAAAFVRSIADSSVLKEIMQDRYDDVIMAVQGIKPFTAPASLAIPSSVVVGTNANANIGVSNLTTAEQSTSIAGPSSTVMPQAAPASNPIAGTKRKYERPPNTIAVIDLT
ncbi:hypothetical protein NMY22_g2261 [Coprinellus aureogranulatus]|nr:hypothetical protein NMY22_g2261 [Coprinellus aureogranulatus]